MPLHDLSFAVRTLRRSPVFTLAAVLTIALGIGASTAIFSVTNAVLLRPLPYTDPDRLVVMYMDLRARHTFGMPLSNENYADIRNGSTGVFEDMAAVRTVRQVLPGADGTPEQIRLALVTTNFFRLMGAQVAVGRDFLDSDGLPQPLAAAAAAPDAQAPPPAVAILSHAYWLRRYGGDPKVLGQRIPGGPRPEIVGVLAPGLELMFPSGANVEQRPDCWVANRLSYDNANRNTFGLRPIGRLKPGVTLARAQEQVESVAAKIRQDFPLQTTAGFYARLEPMHDTLVEEVRPAILALTGAVTFLFLIACANVANLLLVRAWAREGELAVRAALGAGRWRTVRQMLADAFVLTGLGACAGVALAWIGIRELRAIAPANLPRLDAIGIDPTVLGFTAAIALAVAVLFGMVPAWSAFRMDPMTVLRGSGRTAGLSAGRTFRNGVVVAEVALCFVLLVGSGLMFRTFLELQRIDPGFDPRGLLTFQLLGGRPGPPAQRAELARQIEERLRAIPGVERVTASFPFPLAGGFSAIRWGTEEALADNSKYQAVDWQIVRPGYFDTLRTPPVGRPDLHRGRQRSQTKSGGRGSDAGGEGVPERIRGRQTHPDTHPHTRARMGRDHRRRRTPARRLARRSRPRTGLLCRWIHRWRREQVGDARHGRSRQLWKCGAGRHCAGRSAVSHHRAAADGRPGAPGAGRYPFHPDPHRDLRDNGGAAGRRGPVRRAGNGRAPAHCRTGRPHGARCVTVDHPAARGRSRAGTQRRRSRGRPRRRVRPHARDDHHAGGGETDRSADVRGHGCGVPGDRRGVVVAARAPRGGTGPDVGTTRLVTCGWRRDIEKRSDIRLRGGPR